MNSPLVTIGIPAFKGKHFEDALKCWKMQTYANFGVFVQDDCSPDDLRSIFNSVCGGDPRFHFERNETPTAPNFVDNWMKTLHKANGEYFVLGSDDDLYEPDFLERMVELAERHPDVDMLDARHDFIGEAGVVTAAPEMKEMETQIEWLHAVVCEKRNAIAQSVMCRTAALRAIGGFVNLPAAWGGCDWLTWAKLAVKGVANSSKVLMHWRADGGNTTSSANAYWVGQKLQAVKRSRPRWGELVDGLRPVNDDEARAVAEIRERAVRNFFRWMQLCTVDELPRDEYHTELLSAYRHGDIGLWKLCRRWFR